MNKIDYWGGCPDCGGNDGCLNIGKGHWYMCHAHRTRWFVGSNLFSSWKDETEEEQLAEYERLDFGSYRDVEPLHAESTAA